MYIRYDKIIHQLGPGEELLGQHDVIEDLLNYKPHEFEGTRALTNRISPKYLNAFWS